MQNPRVRESVFVCLFKLQQAKLLQTSFYKYTNVGSVINTCKNTSENIKCLYWIENQYATIFYLFNLIPSPMLLISSASLRCCCQLGLWELVRVVRIPSPLPHFPIPCPSKCHPPLGCRVTYPMSKQMSKPIDQVVGEEEECLLVQFLLLTRSDARVTPSLLPSPTPTPVCLTRVTHLMSMGRSNFCFSGRCKL